MLYDILIAVAISIPLGVIVGLIIKFVVRGSFRQHAPGLIFGILIGSVLFFLLEPYLGLKLPFIAVLVQGVGTLIVAKVTTLLIENR
jgi:hypothetical protein